MAVNARDEMKVNEIYLVFQCLTLKRQKPIAPLEFKERESAAFKDIADISLLID